MTIDYAHARELMVEQQIRPWDVLDIKVLDVLARLPREAFVADAHRALAYADVELPIGHGQKMMKPVIEGRTLQALDLQPGDEVLEIGTGSGFLSACIGALAREQQKGSCDAKLTYGNQWADRLPPAFKLYPRATLREAAGVAGGKCNIRVVNFQTAASIQGVLDYYHTMAVRAGYTSDHRVRGNEHILGGTKGDLAYVLFLRTDGGMTDVDLVASGGK